MEILKATTEDGLKLSGLYFKPAGPTGKIIIHIHGMAGDPYSNAFLPAMFSGYPTAGVAFLSAENRGTHSVTQFGVTTGGIRLVGDAYEKFEECVYDIAAWVKVAQELGYTEIWLQGHSLGCSKVAYYVSRVAQSEVAGLLLVSPSDMLGWNLAPAMIADHESMLNEAKQLQANGQGHVMLGKLVDGETPVCADTYVSLFGEGAGDAIFNFGNPELGYETLRSIAVPVLAFTGTDDAGVTSSSEPHKAMHILEQELVQSPRKKTVIYEGAKHDFAGFGERIAEEVLSFIK